MLSLGACGDSTLPSEKSCELVGDYKISEIIVNGFSMGPGEYDGSYLTASKMGNNTVTSLYMYSGDDATNVDLTQGYVTDIQKTSTQIKYKFWVTAHSGSIFTGDGDYFYLYYDIENDSFEMIVGDDMSFVFSKS